MVLFSSFDTSILNPNYTQLKGGEFPALRYSDEETERLLTEAYAAIPPRAGKRGTLHYTSNVRNIDGGLKGSMILRKRWKGLLLTRRRWQSEVELQKKL